MQSPPLAEEIQLFPRWHLIRPTIRVKCGCSTDYSTHQLKFPTSVKCLSNGSILPQDVDDWRPLHKLLSLHGAQRGIEELGLVGGQLVRRVLPLDAQLLARVHQHLHALHDVLVDHMLVLAHQLRLEPHAVDDAHLLQERRLSRLTRSEQQEFYLQGEGKRIIRDQWIIQISLKE